MHELNSLVDYLVGISKKGYGKQLPGKPDEIFSQLADLYLSSGADCRAAIREALPDSCRLLVIGFSDRMAILAERLADRNYLVRAFAAHSIEDFRHDDRENIFRLALASHIAKEIGEDSRALLEEMTQVSSERGANAFRSFLSRPPELNTLQTMKIVKKNTPEGIDYEYQP